MVACVRRNQIRGDAYLLAMLRYRALNKIADAQHGSNLSRIGIPARQPSGRMTAKHVQPPIAGQQTDHVLGETIAEIVGIIVSCRAGDAITYLDRAVKLSPYDPHLSSIHAIRALGHLALGELDMAECFARKATRIPSANRWPFLVLASVLGQTDRAEDTRRAINTLFERSPSGCSIADAQSEFFFCGDEVLKKRYLEGLRRAAFRKQWKQGDMSLDSQRWPGSNLADATGPCKWLRYLGGRDHPGRCAHLLQACKWACHRARW